MPTKKAAEGRPRPNRTGLVRDGLLSQIAPDGRYVVSTFKDLAVFMTMPPLAFSQLFYPVKGILCVFDGQAGTFRALPGG